MSAPPPEEGLLAVELLWSLTAAEVHSLPLRLPAGACVADALRAAAAALQSVPAAQLDALAPSLWGRACTSQTPLRDGDRLALTRGLQVDPKEARRLRYQRDGLRKRVKAPRRVHRGEA